MRGMCVKLALMCATDDGSGAHVLRIVIGQLQPSGEGELARKCYSAEPLSHEGSSTHS